LFRSSAHLLATGSVTATWPINSWASVSAPLVRPKLESPDAPRPAPWMPAADVKAFVSWILVMIELVPETV